MSEVQVITKPLIPRPLWDFCKHLESIDIERYRLFGLFHPKLSVFIEPESVDDQLLKDIVFEESVDLLLVEQLPSGIPRIAFDVCSEDVPTLIKQKKRLFDDLGIHYQVIGRSEFHSFNEGVLNQVMADTPNIDALADVINNWQWQAMQELDKIARQKGLFLLHEVALDSVISVDPQDFRLQEGGTSRQQRHEKIAWQDRSFLRKTSFDGVLCTPPPNSSPILAFEYDGFHHTLPSQRRKDKKKDDACEAANLPLVRIRSTDLPPSEESNEERVGLKHRQDIRRLEVTGILRVLVSELSERQLGSRWYLEQVHHFLVGAADSIRKKVPELADDIVGYSQDILLQAKRGNEKLLLAREGLVDMKRDLAKAREMAMGSHGYMEEQEYEDNFLEEHFHFEYKPMLEEDFENAIWTKHKGIKTLEWKYDKEGEEMPWYLEVRGSELLEHGGLKLYRRFDGSRTELKVIADRFEIASKLKEKGTFISLRERATESLMPQKAKIIEAISEGIRLQRRKKQAYGWMRGTRGNRDIYATLEERLKTEIKNEICTASRRQTPDYRMTLKKVKELIDSAKEDLGIEYSEEEKRRMIEERHSEKFAPRNLTQQEIFQRQKSAVQKIKEIIPFLEVEDALKAELLEYARKVMNEQLLAVKEQNNCQIGIRPRD